MFNSAKALRLLAAAGALAMLFGGAAGASTSTDLLGNTRIDRLDRDGLPEDSNCPAGSFAVGVRVWVDSFPRIQGVAAWCADSAGAVTLGNVAGVTSASYGDSLCDGTDLAAGLHGAWGEVMNALGARCAGASGTYAAPRVGNQATTTTAADCPGGDRLNGLTAWSNFYGGFTNVYGVQGHCDSPIVVSGVSQPINADGSSIFKAGSTVPVKFTANVADLSATLSVAMISNDVEGTFVEASTNVAASTGFRYDATTGQYIYNWSTKGLDAGTYRLAITIADGPTITVDLSLR